MEQITLFPPQQDVIRMGLLDSPDHLLLNMATGSGKTHLAELAIEQVVRNGYKAIYLTPLRAIASQQYEQWKNRFPNVKIGIFTGETIQTSSTGSSYTSSQVLIMTPERLDACMRNWRSHWGWIPDVSLLVIDEFHILGQPQRGARLEGTMTRLIRLNPFLRIIALSATMPNTDTLSAWLHGLKYSSQWRQVPIEKKVLRFKSAKEKPELLLEEVRRCVNSGGQSLVFCNSRSRAQSLAAFLAESGIPTAFHHAGIDREKRAEVEKGYKSGSIRVLVATSTLEMGLNLPARQVVIYDSYVFNESGFDQLPVWSYIQRAGRAGRPGLDESGEAVLMLPRWGGDAGKYLREDCEQISSQLVSQKSMQEQILIDIFAGYSRTSKDLSDGFLPMTLYKKQHPEATINGAVNRMLLADLITETEDEASGERTLRCGLLGRLSVKLMLAPETVKLIKDAYSVTDRLYLYDLLLIAAMSPDCSPVLQANYEEMDTLCENVQPLQSSLISVSVEKLRKDIPDVPAVSRLLSAIKMAAICYALTEGRSVDDLAEAYDVYDADVIALKESVIRILQGITAVIAALDKAAVPEDILAGRKKDPSYTPNLSSMLILMLQYGICSRLVPLTYLRGVGGKTAKRLAEAGYDTVEKIADADFAQLSRIPGIGKKLAAAMIKESPELQKTLSNGFYTEERYCLCGERRDVRTAIDPYRLRRSLELVVKGSDGCKYCVSGGREDHIVLIRDNSYVCDCMDYEKNGGDCKHILCVKRAMGNAEVSRMVKRIKEDKHHSIREALPSLWYSMTAVER